MTAPDTIPAPPLQPDAQIAHAGLALLGELAGSLRGSQHALLALDLAGIERGARQQVGLSRAIGALLLDAKTGVPRLSFGGSELAAELRAAGKHVLQLARVQAALLARARRALRTRSNLLAGPSATYGPFPPPERAGALPVEE